MSRSGHSQSDMAVTVTITITVEGHFSMLIAFSEAEECPEKPVELPDPSHPG